MATIEILCIMAMTTFLCVCCFILGARIGQKVINKQEVKMPNLNPISAINNVIKEHHEQKEVEREQEKLEIIANNIDNYDGTGLGQKDIPR